MSQSIFGSPDRLSCEDMTGILHDNGLIGDARVTGLRHEVIGEGLLGDSFRFHIDYDRSADGAPATVVGKFASQNEAARQACAEHGLYRAEALFYRELAATVAVRCPGAYYAGYDEATGDLGLILEDMGPAEAGNQIEGTSVERCFLAIDQAAALHGPRWNDPALARTPWLISLQTNNRHTIAAFDTLMDMFRKRFGDMLEPEYMAVFDTMAARMGDFVLREPRHVSVCHNDFRLDNMLFEAKGGTVPIAILDWQTPNRGSPLLDVAYFLSQSIPADVRGAHEKEFLTYYHERLQSHGVRDLPFADLEREYRIAGYSGMYAAVVASMMAKQTPRGDEMFMIMARGAVRQILDLETLKIAL